MAKRKPSCKPEDRAPEAAEVVDVAEPIEPPARRYTQAAPGKTGAAFFWLAPSTVGWPRRFGFGTGNLASFGGFDRHRDGGGRRRGLRFLVQAVAQPLPLPMIQARMKKAHIFGWLVFRRKAGLLDVRCKLIHPSGHCQPPRLILSIYITVTPHSAPSAIRRHKPARKPFCVPEIPSPVPSSSFLPPVCCKV